MFIFLIPLLIGFTFNSVSAFTTFFSVRLGVRGGRFVCIIFRNIIGIPVWVIGYGMAAITTSFRLFTPTVIISALAWLLIMSGGVIIIAGMVSLRWRAAAPSISDTLVVNGLYAHIRHPLYAGMFLELIGLLLLLPELNMLVAVLLGILWIILQARLEELDLLLRLPAYKKYMLRVPRFVPKLKL